MFNLLISSYITFRISTFMQAYKHRESKGHTYSNRQSATDHIARVVLGYTSSSEPFKLSHTSTPSPRKRRRKRYRVNIQQLFAQQPHPPHPYRLIRNPQDGRRTVVAYGNASVGATRRGHTPVPVKIKPIKKSIQ